MEYEEPTWGLVAPEELQRIVVLSPHFDDAAMGAGHLLATYPDSTVLTVFAGRPPAYPDPPGKWDAAGGFQAGDDVVGVRREEDLRAMEVLGTSHHWLEFSEHAYLAPPDRPTPDQIAPALERALREINPTAVFAPMGLGNPDHVVVHDTALLVRQSLDEVAWFCYEDHGYKHIPGLLAWRVAKLLRAEPWPTPAIVPLHLDEARKRRAIWSYASQIPPLEQEHALTARMEGPVPEQFWRLAPPPAGWEALSQMI
jgi:LmbE family N-acetylglucosaminyl deacetylase